LCIIFLPSFVCWHKLPSSHVIHGPSQFAWTHGNIVPTWFIIFAGFGM
jgi:hypothetical protein